MLSGDAGAEISPALALLKGLHIRHIVNTSSSYDTSRKCLAGLQGIQLGLNDLWHEVG